MNTVHKFPASKLPAELRGNISPDALVTVVVEDENAREPIPGFTQAELEEIMADSIGQKKQGLGTVCKNREETDAYFDALREKVDAKYRTT